MNRTEADDAVRVRQIAAWWYATGRRDAGERGGDADRFSAQQATAARAMNAGSISYLPSIQDAWTAHVADEAAALLELGERLERERLATELERGMRSAYDAEVARQLSTYATRRTP